MQFTSLFFLFVFLPLAFLGYLPLAKTKLANLYILVVSLLFYAWGSVYSLLILLFILGWNYISAFAIARSSETLARRIQLIFCLAINLLVLFMYKYLNVWLVYASEIFSLNLTPTQLVLPVGLSFYIFSCLSYIFDIYRDNARLQTSFIDFGVFAAFFGRVNMGPIAHYDQMAPQLKHHPISRQTFIQGGILFFQGLFMKVLLADNFAALFQILEGNSTWLGNLLFGFSYFFQLYFDFAGYSRMARGIGSFFGFEIPANFNLPYTALSVQDFWRRWHISLTDWFRKYVYIPLGGNRVSQNRWILNVLAVWALTGIWHGAQLTFLLWGFYQGSLILLERFFLNKYMEKLPSWIRHIYLVITQLVGWTLFFATSLMQAVTVICHYFGIGVTGFANAQALFCLLTWLPLLLAGIIWSTSLPALLANGLKRIFKGGYVWINAAAYLLCFLICIAFMISATNVTFLYAAF